VTAADLLSLLQAAVPGATLTALSAKDDDVTPTIGVDAASVLDVCRALRDTPGLEPTTVAQMRARYGRQPDQIARWVPEGRSFTPLGTDGFGRSDTREALRRHFEIDAPHIVVATLAALAARGDVKAELVADSIRRYDLDPDAIDPRLA